MVAAQNICAEIADAFLFVLTDWPLLYKVAYVPVTYNTNGSVQLNDTAITAHWVPTWICSIGKGGVIPRSGEVVTVHCLSDGGALLFYACAV
jgi:hypothetical protein